MTQIVEPSAVAAEPSPAPPQRTRRLLLKLTLTVLAMMVVAAGGGAVFYTSVEPLDPSKLSVAGRTSVTLADLPVAVRHSFVAAEDPDFYDAGLLGPTDRRSISRQYVRIATGYAATSRATWRDVVLARRLEQEYDKDAILGLYLNVAPFGRNAIGLEQASQAYFGHPAPTLTLAEAAVLAGALQEPYAADGGPGQFDPKTQPDRATQRWREVLASMVEHGWLAQPEMDLLTYPRTI
jgi:membrane peptidoglycan carboxypeptidase